MKDSTDKRWPVYLLDFMDEVLVECPRCHGCATAVCKRNVRSTPPRLSCSKCGFSRRGWPAPSKEEMRRSTRRRCAGCNEWLGKAPVRYVARKRQIEIICPCGVVSFGDLPSASARVVGGVDPYFDLPLWLRGTVRGEEIWAYNRGHLAFLEAYIRATTRQRIPNWNGSLASRLPRWMKKATMRSDVLKAIARIARRSE